MTTYVGSTEAARVLGVSKATLYAYVSRGIVSRRTAVDGRSSLFALDELEAVAEARRRRPPAPRPSVDVQIASAITVLDEAGLTYRGHDVAHLAATAGFRQVAELLWTGALPSQPPVWPPLDESDRRRCRAAIDAIGPAADPLRQLVVIATVLGTRYPGDQPDVAARRMIEASVELLLPAEARPGVARPATSTQSEASGVAAAVDRALVVLADHELATSTLAVRLAGSVRADPYSAFVAGLGVVRAPLHGSAASLVAHLLRDAHDVGAATALRRRLDAGERIPGVGHAIYRGRDPRLDVVIDAVRRLPDPDGHLATLDEVLGTIGRTLPVHPNVDLALGALVVVAGLDDDVPLFAIARLAGWAAHLAEELTAPPLRYRGYARPTNLDA